MALIIELVKVDEDPKVRTGVSADYCFNSQLFQLRSYKQGDLLQQDGQKQNIQLDKMAALDLRDKLNLFIEQAL